METSLRIINGSLWDSFVIVNELTTGDLQQELFNVDCEIEKESDPDIVYKLSKTRDEIINKITKGKDVHYGEFKIVDDKITYVGLHPKLEKSFTLMTKDKTYLLSWFYTLLERIGFNEITTDKDSLLEEGRFTSRESIIINDQYSLDFSDSDDGNTVILNEYTNGVIKLIDMARFNPIVLTDVLVIKEILKLMTRFSVKRYNSLLKETVLIDLVNENYKDQLKENEVIRYQYPMLHFYEVKDAL